MAENRRGLFARFRGKDVNEAAIDADQPASADPQTPPAKPEFGVLKHTLQTRTEAAQLVLRGDNDRLE